MPNHFPVKPLVIATGLAAVAVPLSSLSAENPELEEVVVTAQKRQQNLQETPIAISVFDADALENQGIADVEDITMYVPNVQVAESPGGSTGATIGVRGSVTVNPAITWEPTVGIYMNGVFIAKNVGGIFDVAELERVEVLRGPQGTLYGKNTVGGAVNLITRKPGDEFGGDVRVGVGNYGYTDIFASVDSGTINEGLSFNIAFDKKDRDGFYDNKQVTSPDAADEFKELDSSAGRFAALYDRDNGLEIFYTYDWSDKDNTPSFAQYEVAGTSPKRLNEGAADGAKYDKSETSGHALHISYAMGELNFKSITAYREMSFDDSNDYDGQDFTGFHAQRHVDQDQLSQEFQLIGSMGAVDFVAGIFYFNEDADAINPYFFYVPALTSVIQVDNFYGVESESFALYGQADWHLTEQLTLTGGVRWTTEEKDFYIEHPGMLPLTKSDDSWTNTSPMAVLTYAFSDAVSVYGKIAQGWKSGGFNGEADTVAIASTPYDEETVTSYELGLKSRWMDNRVQANAALFQNDIQDLQLSEFVGTSGYSQIRNAGESTITGMELEVIAALMAGFVVNVNYGYLDGDYDKFEAYGFDIKDSAKFPYTPEEKISLGIEYQAGLGFAQLSARLDWTYTSEFFVYHDAASANLTKVEQYDVVNARVTLSDMGVGAGGNSVKVALWARNLTDEEYRLNGIPFTTSGYAVNYYGDPRTYGVDVTYSF